MSFLQKLRELLKKSPPVPLRVDRVDHEPDEITYEVSSPEQSFHIIFCERDHLDLGLSAKWNAHLYVDLVNNLSEITQRLEDADVLVTLICLKGEVFGKEWASEFQLAKKYKEKWGDS